MSKNLSQVKPYADAKSNIQERIGLLGAAFDPPHFGHFLLAQIALQTGELDQIWMMPSPERWDKSPIGSSQQRLSWLHQAMKVCPPHLKKSLVISDIELQLPAYRGTYWLLSQLRRTHPQATFSLILGWDSFVSIPQWRDPTTGTLNGNELLTTTRIYVTPRAADAAAISEHPSAHPNGVVMLPALDDPAAGDIGWLEGLTHNQAAALSSSLVRSALRKQEPLRFLFTDVENEIRQSGVYDLPSVEPKNK